MKPIMLLEMSDVAAILGLSYSGARRLVGVGKLTPYAQTPRGCRLFTEEQIEVLRAFREYPSARPANRERGK